MSLKRTREEEEEGAPALKRTRLTPCLRLLPTVPVWHDFLDAQEASVMTRTLLPSGGQITWQREHVVMFGKQIAAARRVSYYADPGVSYFYAGKRRAAAEWNPVVAQVRDLVVAQTGCSFNHCILNLYEDGSEHIGQHSDNVADLVYGSPIASVSFGETRDFVFTPKNKMSSLVRTKIALKSGTLLLMESGTQEQWKHGISKSRKKLGPRINMTFRQLKK